MTKVEAIKKVMEANGGSATLKQIYAQAKKYKPDIDQARDWKAGLRGVLYREVRNNRTFKKEHEATYAILQNNSMTKKEAKESALYLLERIAEEDPAYADEANYAAELVAQL